MQKRENTEEQDNTATKKMVEWLVAQVKTAAVTLKRSRGNL